MIGRPSIKASFLLITLNSALESIRVVIVYFFLFPRIVIVTFGVSIVKKLSSESLLVTIYLTNLSLFSPAEGVTGSSSSLS